MLFNMFNMMGNFGTDYDYGMGWASFGFMWFFGILFWVSVIISIIVIVKWLFGHGCGHRHCFGGGLHRHGGAALDILNERYAKGEITKHQYEEMKKELAD